MLDNVKNPALDWDSEILSDGYERALLPEGDYAFEVTAFERGRFSGSEMLCASPKATLTLTVIRDQAVVPVKHTLILNQAFEHKIAAFFRSIGQKKPGEPFTPDWNAVTGSRGRAHFKPRTYKTSAGEDRTVNCVDRFYDFSSECRETANLQAPPPDGRSESPFA